MTVCITGANRGIGLAQTKNFLQEGDTVFATYRSKDESRELFALQEEFATTLFPIRLDVTNEEEVSSLAAQIEKSRSSIDILINNAGVDFEGDNPGLREVSTELIRTTYDINVIGMVLVCKSLLHLLKASKRGAIVVNTSSGIGSMTNEITMTRYGYMMSKAAVNMLSRIMAYEFKDEGITTVAWSPGWVKTRLGTQKATLSLEEAGQKNVAVIKSLNKSHNGKWVDISGEIWDF